MSELTKHISSNTWDPEAPIVEHDDDGLSSITYHFSMERAVRITVKALRAWSNGQISDVLITRKDLNHSGHFEVTASLPVPVEMLEALIKSLTRRRNKHTAMPHDPCNQDLQEHAWRESILADLPILGSAIDDQAIRICKQCGKLGRANKSGEIYAVKVP